MLVLAWFVSSAFAGSPCADGTYSSSSRSGTCSHHGGVVGGDIYTRAAGAPSTQTGTSRTYGVARAFCVDGSLAYRETPSGTCSGHGGVSVWLDGLEHSESTFAGSEPAELTHFKPDTLAGVTLGGHLPASWNCGESSRCLSVATSGGLSGTIEVSRCDEAVDRVLFRMVFVDQRSLPLEFQSNGPRRSRGPARTSRRVHSLQ